MANNQIKFALAQFQPVAGDIQQNLQLHLRLVKQASQQQADIILFPELSLTGYELPMLAKLAMDASSPVFKQLSKAALGEQITIIAGCPIQAGQIIGDQTKPNIGAVICYPDGSVEYYSKQYLTEGERQYCVAGTNNYFIMLNQVKIALAICADFTEPQHYADAQAKQADIYAVSAMISKNGYLQDSQQLASITQKLNIPVLLSNYVGETGGWNTAGNSSGWHSQQTIKIDSRESEQGILLCSISDKIIKNSHFIPLT